MSEIVTLLPLLPLRDVVIYPHMVIPLFVGREKSIRALDDAMAKDKRILLVAQKEGGINEPKMEDLYHVGTVSTILQLLKLPDNTVKVLVEGNRRAEVVKIYDKNYFEGEFKYVNEIVDQQDELKLVIHTLLEHFEKYVKLNKRIPPEILTSLASIDDPGRLADTIAAHVPLEVGEKQTILETRNIHDRLELVLSYLRNESEKMKVEKRVKTRLEKEMRRNQTEYILTEKMKAIQKELSEIGQSPAAGESEGLEQRIKKVGMSQEAQEKALSELAKLRMMPPMSAEATVSRNYIDTLLEVPWKEHTKPITDLAQAEKVLEEDHYGLEKIKERIIEHLAVLKRKKKVRGPILCLVGPPGVGKTSLGESVARATGRKFARISLGGVRDEAEIRGHRRTYIGSLPGKIIQKLIKVKVRNPVFMLDEVDKMSADFRGDPSSALLEVLDPEQNFAFNDHYLEVDYDLSDAMFIATANSMNIPAPLLDRMEVIRLAGYTEDEKLNIAMKYLVNKQIEMAGLLPDEINITESAVLEMIRHYTREAGVRNLERDIAKICRKVVKSKVMSKTKSRTTITEKNVEKYLGVQKYRFGLAGESDQVGQVTGLAWTEVGGELLKIEVVVTPGKAKTTITGRLGDVMQESVQAAMTVVRSRASSLGVPAEFFQEHDIHVHVPEGATPKDGPSAGISMCTAIVSAITNIPVHANIAMTGEITLRGEILPIGGLKEKLIAALRGGIKTVIIPEDNARELKEIPKNITSNLEILPMKWIDQVLHLALTYQPEPLVTNDVATTPPKKPRKKPKPRQSAH